MRNSTSLPRQGGILRPALVVFAALSLVTGLAYPFLTTGIAAAVFPHEAAGSLIKQDNRIVGSELIGQAFSSPGYFWGRPSATAPMPYNGAGSSGSNLGPRNPALADAIQSRIAALKAADPDNPVPVPVDLVTASGSGLDPHISPAAAAYQAARVARARNLSRTDVDALIQAHTERPWLGVLGDPAVNVLTLNLALDQLRPAR
ncbi:potassium-transporting ATPase subunit KdpC [Achromobacter insolitus]|jgi:K+-transporting ATPase ATPase C chain|uniref:potassium-transporting ATPase subunit KdpC n=1 Tax=Achromobacter TaxID=222 RepID=UPI00053816FC|nr:MULTISPECIES: potassium-transporting ATPase subunit KdpC [Achromobacter]AVG43086.1 potassium-transporting ATPase subunit KdpC [Achromobacter insolitus]MEB3095819.1 potassium-transporting ATPase subunit KdpC [Achromobacter sp. D10]NGT14144.1 potassium-transporting ATPase subunit KdpC [Achromobacter insolitus]OAE64448.1 K+-transporting ATPase subunit C [Achromobacter insolitus]OCZ60189.1 K+-transporting ATPase subunit C [Achromobacter insolitus]